MKILVVDDEPERSIPLYNALVEDGNDVVMVDNVQDAIHVWHTQRIEVIISDVNMPYLSGLDLLSSVRKEGTNIPFILYSRSDAKYGIGELASRGKASDFIPNASLKDIYVTVKERIQKAMNDNNAATLST